ncbi:hypothetical protein [Bacillus massiliigorillae]|uniref:hypothetical protein n=1 Tax=Bacillus massiliigorillae TaxID=1243664 RepID=UPI0003A9A5CC|nr:hypothetical protein [Bacillus massiliigorillae]
MKILSGTISLSVSFVLFIYLYGLKADYSVKYHGGLWIFPVILLLLALWFFWSEFPYKDELNVEEKDKN